MAAGKGAAAEYLKSKGFKYYSCSDVLREELKNRGLTEDIPSLRKIGNKLRTKEGPGVLGKRLLAQIEKNQDQPAIADSIRNPAEIAELKKAKTKFILMAVDAPLELRYERTVARGRAGDKMTLAEFKEQDFKQLKSQDPNAQQILDCFKLADYTIVNDGTLVELHQKIDEILNDINNF